MHPGSHVFHAIFCSLGIAADGGHPGLKPVADLTRRVAEVAKGPNTISLPRMFGINFSPW